MHLFSFPGHVTTMRTYIMRCYSGVFIEVAAYTSQRSVPSIDVRVRNATTHTKRPGSGFVHACYTPVGVITTDHRRRWKKLALFFFSLRPRFLRSANPSPIYLNASDYQSFPLTVVTLLDRSFLTNHRINLVSIFKFSSSIARSFEIYIYIRIFTGPSCFEARTRAPPCFFRVFIAYYRGGGERAVTLVRNDVSRAIRTAACITP